jgi:hypothetical protein
MQTDDAAALARLAGFEGPAIGALVSDACALFTHDPALPDADQLLVKSKPDVKPRALRAASALQQKESLALLDLLERAFAGPVVGPAPVAAVAPAGTTADAATAVGAAGDAAPAAAQVAIDPADRLAAWLLAQADLQPAGTVE